MHENRSKNHGLAAATYQEDQLSTIALALDVPVGSLFPAGKK
jgi:hypothetical protein